MNSLSIVDLAGRVPGIDLEQPPISQRRLGAVHDGWMRLSRLIGDNEMTVR